MDCSHNLGLISIAISSHEFHIAGNSQFIPFKVGFPLQGQAGVTTPPKTRIKQGRKYI